MFTVCDAQPLHPVFRLPEPLTLRLEAGEHLALTGPNGGGKTTLGRLIAGALPLRQGHIDYGCPRSAVRFTAFTGAWGDTLPAAHQLRWHHGEDVRSPLVAEFLGGGDAWKSKCEAFPELAALATKPLHWLSSGELRKVHLAKALSGDTRLAVIDEPYIGLDASARAELTAFLERMAERCTLVLLLADERDIPTFVNRRKRVEGLRLVDDICQSPERRPLPERSTPHVGATPTHAAEAIRLSDVSVTYFSRPILQHVSWTVRQGERWALTGANGMGKSLLLSLVCADNPMAYACDVRVFGLKRGHGGSIWDVKRRIGYVSPEQVRGYSASRAAADIVASGLSDTGRLHRRATPAERAEAEQWLAQFGAAHLADRDFLTLSDGEKRITLLSRAFVKQPELLILDEPFHGLDPQNRHRARSVIENYCNNGRTLIMVSHYPEEYDGLVDQIFHLNPQTIPSNPYLQ